jgi:nitrate reductase NapE component
MEWKRDRAAWLMSDKDKLVDSVADNLLDRLEVIIYYLWKHLMVAFAASSKLIGEYGFYTWMRFGYHLCPPKLPLNH